MDQVFAPGCALLIYKPHIAQRLHEHLNADDRPIPMHETCCRHEPRLPHGTRVINTCAGCDKRYRSLYEGVTTVSLWEVLAASDDFPFPDYGGVGMAIHDACPTRTEERVHNAVRELLRRMNIRVVEPANTRTGAVCCGDDLYRRVPLDRVHDHMRKRAESMPCTDVAVYCVSCIKSMRIGGKRPRYIPDLLFGEDTNPGTFDTEGWHKELDAFIETH